MIHSDSNIIGLSVQTNISYGRQGYLEADAKAFIVHQSPDLLRTPTQSSNPAYPILLPAAVHWPFTTRRPTLLIPSYQRTDGFTTLGLLICRFP